jgi:2-oxoglutarate ferredoxin oxidoreductase subunit delta
MVKKDEQAEQVKQPRRYRISIDRELCKGCQLCLSVCPKHRITVSEKLNQKGYSPAEFSGKEENDDQKCTGCTLCAIICPDVAIEVYRE